MLDSLSAMLIGGIIALVSSLITIFFQNRLEHSHQLKQHPSQIVYNKQIEFIDKIVPLLSEINGYITSIDVWTDEWIRTKSNDAKKRREEAIANNSCITKLDELLQLYQMYLPSKILTEANELWQKCLLLGNSSSLEKCEECIDDLFSFQNSIREFIGTDRLSNDLIEALGGARQKKNNYYKKESK